MIFGINNLILGNKTDDFVDRNGNNVPLIGDRFGKFFNWGSDWRVPDDSPDADQSM